MDRRDFTKVMGGVVAGLMAGSKVFALPEEKKAAEKKADTHICKGHNACKGTGSCKTGDGGCAGKNSCKTKGGCKVPVDATHIEKKDKSACSGKSGCKSRR